MPEYKWREISDLPAELLSYRDRELEALTQVWEEQRETIGSEESVAEFNRQLAREWSIETGVIEGVYTLSRAVTHTLIERGIAASLIPPASSDRDPELVARIIQAHQDVLESLFAFVKSGRELSVGYIKELHAALLRYAETLIVIDRFGTPHDSTLEKGVYKAWATNPRRRDGSIHEYCPPEHVASEMDRLIGLYLQHGKQHIPVLVQAAWLHHSYTQIHPFQDGNGRIARALASVVLINAGCFPLVITRDDRARYIAEVEAADRGQLDRLVGYFSDIQKRLLIRAIGHIAGRKETGEYQIAKEHAAKLASLSEQELSRIALALRADLATADPPADGLRKLADQFDYEPNPDSYYYAPALVLKAGDRIGSMIVCLHGIGPVFRGLLGAVVYFESSGRDPVWLSDTVFQFNYRDDYAELEGRFVKWLESDLIQGLAEWRRTLV